MIDLNKELTKPIWRVQVYMYLHAFGKPRIWYSSHIFYWILHEIFTGHSLCRIKDKNSKWVNKSYLQDWRRLRIKLESSVLQKQQVLFKKRKIIFQCESFFIFCNFCEKKNGLQKHPISTTMFFSFILQWKEACKNLLTITHLFKIAYN